MAARLARRIGLFLLTIWGAATLNFFVPRLAPGDPVAARLIEMSQTGGYMQTGIKQMVKAYDKQFGLDQPLWLQYLHYLGNTATFNFGYSLSNYPAKALDVILTALPWTIGLLLVATFIAFVLGTLAGALLAWRKSPRWLGLLMAPLLTLSSVPYYLLGLILVYVLAEVIRLFPLNGAYTTGTIPTLTPTFAWDVLYHSILPGASIVLASLGSWALTMRGMMVTTEGEDFMLFAESRGLKDRMIFLWYGMRNAILPQFTSFALSLGYVASGALLVEIIFSYPGVGYLLYKSVQGSDYFVIYGIAFILILAISAATMILDLTYPLLDPRIRAHERV
ncbi:MAG: ABC transporter permease [Candidatus Dormiibacterota bacterium]